MDGADKVTDPTDWADTAVTSLQPVESALRCQVCKEVYQNPVITSCCHTFCSICIRRCLSNDGKCPVCRTADQSIRLRKNVALEEVVAAFMKARPEILQMGKDVLAHQQGATPHSLKRKLESTNDGVEDDEYDGTATKRKTRSQSRRVIRSRSPSIYEVSDAESEPKSKTRKPVNDGKVECPICQVRMKEEEVSPHIDRIHSEPVSAPPKTMFGLQHDGQTPANGAEAKPKAPEPLSAISYNLMNDSALRKKFQALGIPAHGAKQAMIRRHQEWMNIWNANCDSSKPRPKRDLLRDLDIWERTQGSQARGNTDADGIMSKTFDGNAWSRENGDDFKQLIARARAQKASKSTTAGDDVLPERPAESVVDVSADAQALDPGQRDFQQPNGVT